MSQDNDNGKVEQQADPPNEAGKKDEFIVHFNFTMTFLTFILDILGQIVFDPPTLLRIQDNLGLYIGHLFTQNFMQERARHVNNYFGDHHFLILPPKYKYIFAK